MLHGFHIEKKLPGTISDRKDSPEIIFSVQSLFHAGFKIEKSYGSSSRSAILNNVRE